jgi:hypothetical protein
MTILKATALRIKTGNDLSLIEKPINCGAREEPSWLYPRAYPSA